MEGGVLDEHEIARPALVRRPFGDRLASPAFDVAVCFDELFERVMTQHYDPAYLRSTTREFGPGDAANRLELESLQPAALAATARTMIASRGTRTPDA